MFVSYNDLEINRVGRLKDFFGFYFQTMHVSW